MGISYTYPSELFKNFMGISNSDVYSMIRYYENHEAEMVTLPVNERFISLCYYNNALFTAEDYKKHIYYSTIVLEKSILENIQFVDGYDVFLHTLERKALSHLALNAFCDAEKMARALIKIDPKSPKYKLLLKKILIRRRPGWVHNAFGFGITSLALWTGIEIAGLIVFEPFYPMIDKWLFYFQNSILAFSFVAILFALAAHYYFVTAEVRKLK
jgi:hypothetical protein